MWEVVRKEKEAKEVRTIGFMTVYVDDILVASEPAALNGIFKALKTLWKCSEEEIVQEGKETRFCGYELKARGIEGREVAPLPKVQEAEDEEMDKTVLREAQSLVGEVMWVAGRTRPDVSYATGLLSRLMHRRPRYTVKMANFLLQYLNQTVDRCLHYAKPDENQEVDKMTVATDASFAPEHEQFRSITGVIISHAKSTLHWLSTRQPFVTQSTCEAELIGFSDGYQAGESVATLLEVFKVMVKRELVGDNRAAISQVVGDTGPWRTRHLRIRAAKVREALREEEALWTARYLEGALLVADGATKALQGTSFKDYVKRLNMKDGVGSTSAEAKQGTVIRKIHNYMASEEMSQWVHEGGTALMGGGAALLCTEKHRVVGALMILFGLCVKGWEESQDRKTQNDNDRTRDQMKREWERSSSVTSGSGAAKRNQQGVTGKPQEGSQVVIGEKTSEKNRKDPLWTMEPKGNDGSATPRVLVNRVTPQNPPQSGRSEEGKGRPLPGLRAMRKGSSSASHGDDGNSQRAGGGKGSAARGAAAMPLLEAQRTTGLREGDELRVHVAVSVTATGGQEEMRGYTSEEKPGPYPTRSTEETGRQVYEGVDRWKNFLDPKLLAKEHQQVPEARREGEPASSGGGSNGQDQGEPWERPIFSHVMTGKVDSWDQRWVGEGWLVRHHAKWRKRYFMPAHSTLPVEGKRLDFKRVSVRCFEDGTRLVEPGDWRDGARTADDRCWRGFTFIRLLDAAADGSGYNAASSTVAAASTALRSEGQVPEPEVSDDGSYELCP